MLYLIALAAGTGVGLAAGGRLKKFLDIKLDKVGMILGAFLLQLAAQLLAVKGIQISVPVTLLIQVTSYVMLFIGFWFNRQYLGMLLTGVGCGLNAAVILANGGRMPVSYEVLQSNQLTDAIHFVKTGADFKHTLIDEGTRLVFLSDIMHPPGILSFGMQVISIGDIFVVFGMFFIIYEMITGRGIIKHCFEKAGKKVSKDLDRII